MSFAIHKKLGTIKEIPKHAEGWINSEWVIFDSFPTKENYFESITNQVEPELISNKVLVDEQFEKVLIDLIVSNYKLGVAEYNRNPNYNNEHFHHKAEVGLLDYLEEHNTELWAKIQDRLQILEQCSDCVHNFNEQYPRPTDNKNWCGFLVEPQYPCMKKA
jgi:hypothetical protein